MLCPVHQKEFVMRPAGISKKTGQPYSAFLACPEYGCREKPPREGGWPAVRQEVAQKVAPGKAAMTREDWEEREKRKDHAILLQVAYKAAVELAAAGKIELTDIAKYTQADHSWLLSQMNGTPATRPVIHSDDIEEGNRAVEDAQLAEMEV
jgi:hypothetical protein